MQSPITFIKPFTCSRADVTRLAVGFNNERRLRSPNHLYKSSNQEVWNPLALTSGNFSYPIFIHAEKTAEEPWFTSQTTRNSTHLGRRSVAFATVSRRLNKTWTCPSFKILGRRTALRRRHWPLPLSMKSETCQSSKETVLKASFL